MKHGLAFEEGQALVTRGAPSDVPPGLVAEVRALFEAETRPTPGG